MRLLLDIGNTRIKWACEHNGVLRDPGALAHRGGDPEALAAWAGELPSRPQAIFAVCVAGAAVREAIAGALTQRFGMGPTFRSTQPHAGVLRNAYPDWARLGADRWFAMRAAVARYPGRPLLVVDAGTAITVDAVASDGQHRGGLILAGLDAMRSVLTGRTGELDRALAESDSAERGSATPWARSSAAAIANAPGFAAAGLVRECAERAGDDSGPATRVLTGGDAPRLAHYLRLATELRPLLVLEGLALEAAEADDGSGPN